MSDQFETISLSVDERQVATVTLARPDKHNAMNATMIAELAEVAADLAERSDIRVVVLAAEGRTFCAGGDLNWMRAQREKDRAGKIAEAMTLARMLKLWNDLPKPVIARVEGSAYGGGLGLIAVSDIVVAAENARFALTETRLGLIPATIGPFVVRKFGEAFARQVFFSARPFGADFMHRAGAVARVCPAGDVEAAVAEEVDACLQCAPGAVAAAKSLCLSISGMDPSEAMTFSAEALADRWETDEAKAGIAAFFASRKK
ncbi:enoyl-CoA hydratase-related protein [Martelella mediterranea]|uniref:1,4-Dihydroxy-2-naphthoyl-CoA synthase n=1 Tax=Martelella mediterranea DSM 17316 TaxID=1122214 RepID=A0A1U9YWQ8_9HYPH|nr:enoyl-CoA hydratase-related protein [Martelella mediterranea]AQZ49877.1 1,4-Dihydroxy-2-naphthoyl-CoA synthase [Martelella mediterranea DSM 17316]